MRNLHRYGMLLCLTVLLAVSAAYGQSKESALEIQLQRAKDLENAGEFEEALKLYRHLDQVYPGNEKVHQGLTDNLERLGRYEELIPLLRQSIKRHPDALDLHIDLGGVLHKTGQRDAAHKEWRTVIDRAPDHPSTYSMVAYEMSRNKEIDEAIAVYQEGRKRLKKPRLFAIELARLYKWRMSYADATRELLAYMEEYPKQYGTVESYLYEFPIDANVVKAVTEVLTQAVRSDTLHIEKHKLLGNYHLAVGRPDQALKEYLWIAMYQDAHDRERSGDGKALFEFASRCQEEKQYDTALQGYASLMDAFPKSQYRARTMLGTGRCLEDLQRYDEAIAHYQALAEAFPGTNESYEAAYRVGHIQLEVKRELEAALTTFQNLADLAAKRRNVDLKYRALLGVGDALLVKGALEEARATYQQVAPVRDKLAYAEVASFRLAELDYYTGAFDRALKQWEAVTLRFPKGNLVNDALGMIMRIEEISQASLNSFAQAEYLGRQGRFDEAIEVIDGWLSKADEYRKEDQALALLLLSQFREGKGDYEGAIEACQTLVAKHSSSSLCPEVQQRIGQLYEHRVRDIDRAISQYELVLANYPESLLTDEVRRTLRKLTKQKE